MGYIYTCDRCGEKIDMENRRIKDMAITRKKRISIFWYSKTTNMDKDCELCETCSEEFETWLNLEDEK